MSEFTKGPWRVVDKAHTSGWGTCIAAGSKIIVRLSGRGKLNKDADASLIAAAPDLYRELDLIIQNWEGEPEDLIGPMEALAKARGEHE